MSSLRVKLSHLSTKRVPALSLIVVAMAGMVVGVLAATISISNTASFTGEQGVLHTNSGILAISDNGLLVVSNVPGTTNNTATFLTTGNKNVYSNAHAFAVGDWVEALVVTDTSGSDTGAHAVKITINDGAAAPSGANVIPQVTYTMTGVSGSTSPTITIYIDLGTASILAPLNIYVNSN